MKLTKKFFALIAVGLLFIPAKVNAQDSLNTIGVFLDCRRSCNESFVRDEIKYVNYVRNIEDAEVHLLITNQRTSSGGREYTLQFIGVNRFLGTDKERLYYTAESDTEIEVRQGLNNNIKIGLFSYLEDLPISNELVVEYVEDEENSENREIDDNWDYWVFDINADTDLEGEKSEQELSIYSSISAERITPEWKFEFEIDQFNEQRTFKDDSVSRTFKRESRGADLLLVKSLNEHWSAGITARANQSSRNNFDLLLEGSPAIEYSIFPYREFNEREITFVYRMTAGYNDYIEKTVFGKSKEMVYKQQLRANLQFTKPWGEFEAQVNGYTFLDDLSKNRVDTEVQLNFRIFRGLSMYISGEYDWINDQINIPAGEITEEEQLLNLRERATSYSYELRFGLELSFGSIYNNVVNPRL